MATDKARHCAEILDRMRRLHPRLIDLSLDRVLQLLDALGNPQEKLPPVVHIAGTNGKGSTLAYMRAGLEAAGLKVHVYTSPYLVRFNERIRLAGELISDDLLADMLCRVEEVNQGREITEFEITTATAFLAFAEVPADILLLETGLGGRFDATNVIGRPALTVITTISRDHEQFLGNTIAAIAFEKAGILKPGVACVLAPQEADAHGVIAGRAAELGVPLIDWDTDWRVEKTADGLQFTFRDQTWQLPAPALNGAHQSLNAGLALAALLSLPDQSFDKEVLERSLQEAQWAGRLQQLTKGPLAEIIEKDFPAGTELWLDGGHNPGAGVALAETLTDWCGEDWPAKPLYLIVEMLASKDVTGFLEPFAPLKPTLYATAGMTEGHEVTAKEELAEKARACGLEARCAANPDVALSEIARLENEPARILICGSLYLAGTILAENG